MLRSLSKIIMHQMMKDQSCGKHKDLKDFEADFHKTLEKFLKSNS